MNYKSTYISHDIDTSEVIETFGKLLHQLNAIMNNMDSDNVKRLNTNKTVIKSEDGCTEIDGAKLIMRDGSGTERLSIGAEKNGTFVFRLNNAAGQNSIKLSSSGDAVFCGDIETEKNASVGNNLYIGKDETGAGEKMIKFYDDAEDDSKQVLIRAVKSESGVTELEIRAEKIKLNTLSGVTDAGGYYFVTTSPYSAYVVIDGTEYPVKFR